MPVAPHKPAPCSDCAKPPRSMGISFFSCLWLFILCAGVPALARGAEAGRPVGRNPGPGLSFAVADFDGDHRPDLASVQDARAGSNPASGYLIRLRLSDSGRRYIRVAAPEGGLSVEARDVNGDNAIDLVFATAWLGQPVAVLINDGHGNFSPTNPSGIPEALVQSNTAWNDGADRPSDVSAIFGKSRVGEFQERIGSAAIEPSNEGSASSNIDLFLVPSATIYAGRAPPLAVLL